LSQIHAPSLGHKNAELGWLCHRDCLLACETDIERTDLETVITDLLSGQFNDPVRVVAFNTLEHWAQDVSKDIALEIQSRCDIDGHDVPETLRDFVDSHAGPDRQLALRLA